MKTNWLRTTIMLLIFIMGLSIVYLHAQRSYIQKRWNIKAGYARYTTTVKTNGIINMTGNYRLECNYGIFGNFETGAYIGYSSFPSYKLTQKDTLLLAEKINYSTPFYGVNLNLHILPYFIEAKDFRFDFYLTGKFGGYSFLNSENSGSKTHHIEYGAGIGISFYLFRHLGIYTEYCYGKYFFEDNNKLRYGLTCKF